MAKDPVYYIIVNRLAQFYDAAERLGLGTITDEEVMAAPIQSHWRTEVYGDDGRAWHLGRIHYLAEGMWSGLPMEPIELDNDCTYETIGPPVIIDGHHRFLAAQLANAHAIPATYGGRCDILNYLRGKRKTAPKDLRDAMSPLKYDTNTLWVPIK